MRVESERKVTGAIRSLANARELRLEYASVLPEALFEPVLIYGSGREN